MYTQEEYNKVVNITSCREANAVNFLESLKYRHNLETFIQIADSLSDDFELLPSFKSRILSEEGFYEIDSEEQCEMRVFLVDFKEKNDLVYEEVSRSGIDGVDTVDYLRDTNCLMFVLK
jgi:hypothetical protein